MSTGLIIGGIIFIVILIVVGYFVFKGSSSSSDAGATVPGGTGVGAYGSDPNGVPVNGPQTATSTAETNQTLTIIDAEYGSEYGTNNVTSKVQSMIPAGQDSLIINPAGAPAVLNQIFGDPSPNHAKQLTIKANLGGGEITYGPFNETDVIKINAL